MAVDIIRSPESIAISDSTVSQEVGLCYFDPDTEALIELNAISNPYISVEPFRAAIRKMYLVISPHQTLSYIKIQPSLPMLERENFGIKIIINHSEPSAADFTSLPEFNRYRVDSPAAGGFIPLWIYVESKIPATGVLSLTMDVEFE